MPRKTDRIISWHKARQCWRKKHNGRRFYLATGGVCKGPDDQEGCEIALGEWFDIKRTIDSGEPDLEPVAAEPNVTLIPTPFGEPFRIPHKTPVPLAAMATDYSRLPDALPGHNVATVQDAPVDDLVAIHLSEIRQRVDAGERAITTYRDAVDKLADFQGYARKYKRQTINEVDAHFLAAS